MNGPATRLTSADVRSIAVLLSRTFPNGTAVGKTGGPVPNEGRRTPVAGVHELAKGIRQQRHVSHRPQNQWGSPRARGQIALTAHTPRMQVKRNKKTATAHNEEKGQRKPGEEKETFRQNTCAKNKCRPERDGSDNKISDGKRGDGNVAQKGGGNPLTIRGRK